MLKQPLVISGDKVKELEDGDCLAGMIAEVRTYAGSDMPHGWMALEGQTLAVSDYPDLFAAIGNQYGGDGVSHFALPARRSSGSARQIMYVGRYPQIVHGVSVPATIHGPLGYFKAGDTLSFSVQLLDGIAVSGGPVELGIDIGGTVHMLAFTDGTATEWIFADYVVQPGDSGAVTAELNVNGAGLMTVADGHAATLSIGAYAGANVDTEAPTITVSSLKFAGDSGSSGTDFVTNIAAQTINATLSDALSATEQLYGSLDDGATWEDITHTVYGVSLSWGVTLTASNTLRFKVVDLAGNEGPETSQVYVLDTTAPTAPTVDGLTTANTTPTITGTATVGAGEVLRVAVNYITYTAGGADLTLSGSDWTLVIPANRALAAGTYSVTATVTDTAGNAAIDATTGELVITA